jgi:hypothetical protein
MKAEIKIKERQLEKEKEWKEIQRGTDKLIYVYKERNKVERKMLKK